MDSKTNINNKQALIVTVAKSNELHDRGGLRRMNNNSDLGKHNAKNNNKFAPQPLTSSCNHNHASSL